MLAPPSCVCLQGCRQQQRDDLESNTPPPTKRQCGRTAAGVVGALLAIGLLSVYIRAPRVLPPPLPPLHESRSMCGEAEVHSDIQPDPRFPILSNGGNGGPWLGETAASALRDACAPVAQWCGPCCVKRAAHTGARVQSIRAALEAANASPNTNARLTISVVGNSVARKNKFGTTRHFIDALRQAAPQVYFEVDYGTVAGGFSPAHFLKCGAVAGVLQAAHIIIIEWSAPSGQTKSAIDIHFEGLIRLILSLPGRPLVMYVSHCLMGDFSTDASWINHPDHNHIGEPKGYFESMRTYERNLTSHYGIPFVDTCAAFSSFIASGPAQVCPDIREQNLLPEVSDLIKLMLPDSVHQSKLASRLQGCLLAHTVLGPPSCDTATLAVLDPLPEPAGNQLLYATPGGEPLGILAEANETAETAVFCLAAKDGSLHLDDAGAASGWARVQGGHGGRKVWLAASTPGARFLTRTPHPATHYTVEVYTHHDLPLGLLQVQVNGTTTIIDPCCAAPQCEGTGLGRGLYAEFRVPSGNATLPLSVHVLDVKVIDRVDGAVVNCAVSGSDISLGGLIGLV